MSQEKTAKELQEILNTGVIKFLTSIKPVFQLEGYLGLIENCDKLLACFEKLKSEQEKECCANCKFWKKVNYEYGEYTDLDTCNKIGDFNTLCALEYDADDDTNMWAELVTKPTFNCIHFEHK